MELSLFTAANIRRLLWGTVLMLTATCWNSGTLLATRFFLGFLESTIGPGLTVLIAMFYKRSEQPLRMGAWFMGNVIAGFLGGIVSYGIGHTRTIAPWKVRVEPCRVSVHYLAKTSARSSSSSSDPSP